MIRNFTERRMCYASKPYLPGIVVSSLLILLGSCQTKSKKPIVRTVKEAVAPQILEKSKNDPTPRALHTGLWNGSGMIIWGGLVDPKLERDTPDYSGGVYYPEDDRWVSLQRFEPNSRYYHSSIWTGERLIIWGGLETPNDVPLNSGMHGDLQDDQWKPLSKEGALTARSGHSAIWTGSRMMVWGGIDEDAEYRADGAFYELRKDKWSPLNVVQAPSARAYHAAFWTGSKMIIWGGTGKEGLVNTGGVFNAETSTWVAMNSIKAPQPRVNYSVIWTGSEMIVWGGRDSSDQQLNDGARYRLETDTWLPMAKAPNQLQKREFHTAVWTGKEMLIWGGHNAESAALGDGAVYDPVTDEWRLITTKAPEAKRTMHSAVWTGEALLIFGGKGEDRQIIKESLALSISIVKESNKPSSDKRYRGERANR